MATLFDVERFLNIRAANGPSFSPDGRYVAFLTNVTGYAQAWLVSVEGGWPEQLTFGHDSVRGVYYSPRQHELIFGMDAGGDEQIQLYRLHGVGAVGHSLGEGWTTGDLTRAPKAVHQFGGWSHDGTQIAFSANRESPSRFDVYVQRIAIGNGPQEKPRLVQKGPGGYYTVAGWSPDDHSLLVRRTESNFNQDLYLVAVDGSGARHLTPHKGDVQYHSPAWSGDGKHVYCASTAEGKDLTGLARINVADSSLSFLETPAYEVEATFTSPKGRWLAWLTNAGGKSEVWLRDLRNDRTTRPPGLPLGVVTDVVFAPDETKAAIVFDGPRFNPDVWLWDLAADRLKPLTHASRAGIPVSSFVVPELIEYPTFDNRKIPAWFYPAPAADGKPAPVIVYPHGGPESQTRPRFSALFEYFQQHGYAILAPNVRGSSGYGTAFMNLDNTTKRMDSVKDLAHAAYWIRDQKKGDPKRLAVYGGSYGGFMVLAAVTNYPDLWAAGIDVVGIANFVTFLENTGAYRRAHREAEYGNLREHREFLEKISPIHHVNNVKCPMMVIHGANDPRVPVGEAEQIVAALKKRSIPVEYLRYPDEGHGLAKLKNRLDAYPKMVAFLDRYLKG